MKKGRARKQIAITYSEVELKRLDHLAALEGVNRSEMSRLLLERAWQKLPNARKDHHTGVHVDALGVVHPPVATRATKAVPNRTG